MQTEFDKIFASPRASVQSAQTVDVFPVSIIGLRPIAFSGRSVRFTDTEGNTYFASKRIANDILQNKAKFIFAEVRELKMLQPSGKEATITQNWLATPSRF